jgi:hypothetical protein
MRLDVFVHLDSDGKLDQILAKLDQILKKEDTNLADLTTLQAEVANNTSVEQSAIALLQGLKAQLDAAGTDPVALKALSDQLASNDTALAAAVAANTPAQQ